MSGSKKKWMVRILRLICIAVFTFSAYQIWSYYSELNQSEQLYEDMAEEKAEIGELITKEDSKAEPTPAELYGPFEKMNEDFIGWLTIEGTMIDYPVVQSIEEDYYLYRDFNKEQNRCGSIFLDSKCDLKESDNLLFHGHHMKNGSMFAALNHYTSKSFYQEHKTIRFDTVEAFGEYEVFAVMRIGLTEEEHFPYYDFIGKAEQEEFETFIDQCKKLSLYETAITPQFGDHLITLSTCEYTKEEGRMVVMARKIG